MLTQLTFQAVGLTHPFLLSVLLQLTQQHVYLAVTDMFFDYPFDLDANDKECVRQYGIHSQYNWAAYK